MNSSEDGWVSFSWLFSVRRMLKVKTGWELFSRSMVMNSSAMLNSRMRTSSLVRAMQRQVPFSLDIEV